MTRATSEDGVTHTSEMFDQNQPEDKSTASEIGHIAQKGRRKAATKIGGIGEKTVEARKDLAAQFEQDYDVPFLENFTEILVSPIQR